VTGGRGLALSAVSRLIRARPPIRPVFTRALEAVSALRLNVRRTDQSGQPHQVVGCATEDELPIDLVQSAIHVAHRTGLLKPSNSLSDQSSAGQADGVAGVPRGSAVEVGEPSLLVLRDMRGDVQLARGRGEVLRVVGLVRAYSDPKPKS